MLFNSVVYILLFLPIVVVVYSFLNRYKLYTLSKLWLVTASLFFYGYQNPLYLPLIACSVLINFFLGSCLWSTEASPCRHFVKISRKHFLILGIFINTALLLFFKYSDFFIINMNRAFSSQVPLLNLAHPLAISFFTFQQIAFLCDAYYGITSKSNLLSYSLFVVFFPQLIAGPINHKQHIVPQFEDSRNRVLNWDNIVKGTALFTLGLFKKVFVADTFSGYADMGFNTSAPITFFDAWGASLSYTFQLYYDFSGYTDMAIGAALFFNIKLPVNFDSPYKSRSIQEFWRRWHITLSLWLRDYIYIPLGGNRSGHIRVYLNVLITFLIGGLWHGAAWSFVIWGGMHGVALCIYRLWKRTNLKMNKYAAWTITFLFVNFAWVFFRAGDMGVALKILKGMFAFNRVVVSTQFASTVNYLVGMSWVELVGTNNVVLLPIQAFFFLLIFGIGTFISPNSLQLVNYFEYNGRWRFRPDLRHAFVYATAAALALYGILMSDGTEFLYFKF